MPFSTAFNLTLVYAFCPIHNSTAQRHLKRSTNITHIRNQNVYPAYYYTSWKSLLRDISWTWYSWKIGEITLWDFDMNKRRPLCARERKCHFAIWADSSRLHNRASSCILQLWQCSTHRIDWTTSASFTPWARKEACENSFSAHLLPRMT